jgi:hypothetical protein
MTKTTPRQLLAAAVTIVGIAVVGASLGAYSGSPAYGANPIKEGDRTLTLADGTKVESGKVVSVSRANGVEYATNDGGSLIYPWSAIERRVAAETLEGLVSAGNFDDMYQMYVWYDDEVNRPEGKEAPFRNLPAPDWLLDERDQWRDACRKADLGDFNRRERARGRGDSGGPAATPPPDLGIRYQIAIKTEVLTEQGKSAQEDIGILFSTQLDDFLISQGFSKTPEAGLIVEVEIEITYAKKMVFDVVIEVLSDVKGRVTLKTANGRKLETKNIKQTVSDEKAELSVALARTAALDHVGAWLATKLKQHRAARN